MCLDSISGRGAGRIARLIRWKAGWVVPNFMSEEGTPPSTTDPRAQWSAANPSLSCGRYMWYVRSKLGVWVFVGDSTCHGGTRETAHATGAHGNVGISPLEAGKAAYVTVHVSVAGASPMLEIGQS